MWLFNKKNVEQKHKCSFIVKKTFVHRAAKAINGQIYPIDVYIATGLECICGARKLQNVDESTRHTHGEGYAKAIRWMNRIPATE